MSLMKTFNKKSILKFYPYKIFNINNSIYLYTINASGLFEIDERILELLKNDGRVIEDIFMDLQNIFTFEEFIDVLHSMAEEKFLKFDEDAIESNDYKEKISALTLMIVQECNMRCSYCYGHNGEYNNKGKMGKEVAFKAVDFLVENSDKDNLSIAFLGGEPLLNMDLVKSVVEYSKNIGEERKKKFTFTITTNGTLIDEEIEKYLTDNHIVTQISIDGAKDKHDANRYFDNKKGSYDTVINNTKSMREKSMVTARATISNNNFSYIDIFEHLQSLGFRAIPIAIAQNMIDDSEYSKVIDSYRDYIEHFHKLVKNKEYSKARKMTDIIVAMEKIEFASERNSGCGAAKHMYAVDIDGNLYPCHRFVSNKEYSLGSIYDGVSLKRDKFISDINISSRPHCKECWAQNLCLGGCPYENTLDGKEYNFKERNCELMKMLYEELLRIYVSFDDIDKKEIFSQSKQIK